MKRWLSYGIAMAAVTLSGCLPFPHMEQHVPPISGVLLKGGRPVSNVKVTLSHYAFDGKDPKQKTVLTAADGSFAFERQRPFRLFIWAGDQIDRWELTFGDSEGSDWSLKAYGGGPAKVHLRCDMIDGYVKCGEQP